MRVKEWLLMVGAAAITASCGGGGGDGGGLSSSSGGTQNLTSAPGESALVTYTQSSHQYALTARDNSGNDYSLQLSSTPNSGTTTFNGTANANSTARTLNLYKNGVLAANDISTTYYVASPFQPLGETDSKGYPYAIVTSYSAFPTTLTVGNSGPFDALTYYHDSMMSMMDGMATETYSVSANNATTLNFCVQSVISGVTAQGNADGMANGTETDCYTDDAGGNVALASVTISVSGVTLKFQ